MIHEEFSELIFLASVNELDDFNNHKLAEHLKECADCKEEYIKMKSFGSELTSGRPKIQDPYLLYRARRELRLNLAHLQDQVTLADSIKNFFSSYKLALGAVGLFITGLFTGLLMSSGKPSLQDQTGFDILKQDNIKIGNISFIDSDPADGEISFAFDAVKPVTVRGRVSDSHIQQILVYSLLNEKNDGIRLRAISTIASQENIRNLPGEKIKSTLIKTIKSDPNPGVRREALLLLNRMNPDPEIIEALLYVLENDTNSGLRIAAINSFDPEKIKSNGINTQLINILTQKSREDENDYIKMRARTVLEEVTSNEEL